jgi:signal transduction histidine kinase
MPVRRCLPGGSLRIRCESLRGHSVGVSFTDTGVGIKPEHLQRIFDLYYTTKEKGSGIGLSMVCRRSDARRRN